MATTGTGRGKGRVRMRATVERRRSGEGPLLEATLDRHAVSGGSPEDLAPLRMPEVARVLLRDMDSRLLREGRLRFSAGLEEGTHAFPLAEGPGFQVVVAPGTRAEVRVELGAPPATAWSDGAVVRSLEADLYPAVVLPNVMQTLWDLRHLFEDKTFEAFRQAWEAPLGRSLRRAGAAAIAATGLAEILWSTLEDPAGLAPRLLERARGGISSVQKALADGSLEFGEVHLATVRGRPRWNAGEARWELEFAFSGEVRVLDRVTWPFRDVVLPSAILPVPHASLDALLSEAPLATGVLHPERLDRRSVMQALWSTFRDAEVEGDIEGLPPVLGARIPLVDRTEVVLRGALPESGRLRFHGQARRDGDSLHLRVPRAEAVFDGGTVRVRADLKTRLDFGSPGRGLPAVPEGTASVDVRAGSVLPSFEARARTSHPLATGTGALKLRVEDVRPRGGLVVSWDAAGAEVRLPEEGLSFKARVSMPRQDALRLADAGLSLELRDGTLEGSLKPARDGSWRVRVQGGCTVEQRVRMDVTPIPELHVEDPRLEGGASASLNLDLGARLVVPGRGRPEFRLSPSGSLALELREGVLRLDGRTLTGPAGARLQADWREGEVSSRGLGAFAVDVAWDAFDRPFVLEGADGRRVELSAPSLARGGVTVHAGAGGRVSFRAGEGVRGSLLGRLLGGDSGALGEVVESGEALDLLSQALTLFDRDLARQVLKVRDGLRDARRHLREEGIEQPGDAIPRRTLARLASRFLAGDTSLADRIEPLVRDVTEGRGLELRAAKTLVSEALPDLDADYEVDRVLRWLDLVTRPGSVQSPPAPRDEPPIDRDPHWLPDVADLPSAAGLYHAAERKDCPEAMQQRVADVAPELTLAQLDWILARAKGRWAPHHLDRLRYVRAVKRAVARVEAESGPLGSASQAAAIAGLLGEAVGPLPGLDEGRDWPPPCALGPVDVALLMQAGLGDPVAGTQAQVNNRLLLELVRSRPGDFLRAVLVECGQHVPRILAGVLMAFLNQDQGHMKEPLDLPALLSTKLGLPVPRRQDFLAGGRRVRASYYQALSELAETILAQAGPYLARRARLREVHHPAPPPLRIVSDRGKALEHDARAAVTAADVSGRRLRRDGSDRAPAARAARAAYLGAADACAALLAEEPAAFQRPWLREFWARNEEALKVWSVVDNVRGDVDDVRRWLEVTLGRPVPEREPDLVAAVIDALYAFPADREALARDPLASLLVEPPPGRYDLSVVSAMGVITDGQDGRELEDAWRRLEERRGVKLVRAHTGLFRSLEYNASAILRAVATVPGTWAWIGYSQGCANGLLAESFLRGGTPDQQKVLERLAGRNLLFSAANGSVHGTCGAEKMLKAMVEGERFLKHYQARYSQPLIDLFLRSLQVVLDSRKFVETLGGAHSLTLERALALHRDGQFAPWVPTSTTAGVVDLQHIPEALEWLWWMHGAQMPGAPHDSQVPFEEAVGHATRVRNERTQAFARCEIPSRVQAAHHWSPLTAEVEFVTTARDRERAVYQSPKDRHVLPWIEALARFGRVRRL